MEWHDLPGVFSQRTERNDRVCSLLSAVLMRRIHRPSFADAIEAEFPSALEARSLLQYSHEQEPVILLIHCGSENNGMANFLKKTLSSTAMIWADIVVDHSKDATVKIAQMVDTLHPDKPVFVISLDFAVERIPPKYFTTKTNLAGIMCIHPTNTNPFAGSVPPILVVSYRDDRGIPRAAEMDAVSSFPNVILVSIQKSCNKESERLWMARTLLKFIGAVLNTTTTSLTSALTTQSHVGAVLKLGSRL